jgi:hypothetical protein
MIKMKHFPEIGFRGNKAISKHERISPGSCYPSSSIFWFKMKMVDWYNSLTFSRGINVEALGAIHGDTVASSLRIIKWKSAS